MNRALAAALLAPLIATPAFGQQATGKIDWTKPVIGVDGNIFQPPRGDAARPVEVYSIEELKVQGSPSVTDFVKSLNTELACDPAAKTADKAPCAAKTPPKPQ